MLANIALFHAQHSHQSLPRELSSTLFGRESVPPPSSSTSLDETTVLCQQVQASLPCPLETLNAHRVRLATAVDAGDDRSTPSAVLAGAHLVLSDIHLRCNEVSCALASAREALKHCRKRVGGAPPTFETSIVQSVFSPAALRLVTALQQMGRLCFLEGFADEALLHISKALSFAEENHFSDIAWECLLAKSSLEIKMGKLSEAAVSIEQAKSLAAQIGENGAFRDSMLDLRRGELVASTQGTDEPQGRDVALLTTARDRLLQASAPSSTISSTTSSASSGIVGSGAGEAGGMGPSPAWAAAVVECDFLLAQASRNRAGWQGSSMDVVGKDEKMAAEQQNGVLVSMATLTKAWLCGGAGGSGASRNSAKETVVEVREDDDSLEESVSIDNEESEEPEENEEARTEKIAASLAAMKVVELKSELERRGLATTGLKAALVQRLAGARAKEDAPPAARGPSVKASATKKANATGGRAVTESRNAVDTVSSLLADCRLTKSPSNPSLHEISLLLEAHSAASVASSAIVQRETCLSLVSALLAPDAAAAQPRCGTGPAAALAFLHQAIGISACRAMVDHWASDRFALSTTVHASVFSPIFSRFCSPPPLLPLPISFLRFNAHSQFSTLRGSERFPQMSDLFSFKNIASSAAFDSTYIAPLPPSLAIVALAYDAHLGTLFISRVSSNGEKILISRSGPDVR